MTKRTIDGIKCPQINQFVDESVCDVMFIIEGIRFPALKQILIQKSQVFRHLFSQNRGEVVVRDTPFLAFKTLIDFLYWDQLVFKDYTDFQLIYEVCKLSVRCEVPRLLDRISYHLTFSINLKNFDSILRIAVDYGINDLKDRVLDFIYSNINEVMKRDVKELNQLNQMTNNRLLYLLINQ